MVLGSLLTQMGVPSTAAAILDSLLIHLFENGPASARPLACLARAKCFLADAAGATPQSAQAVRRALGALDRGLPHAVAQGDGPALVETYYLQVCFPTSLRSCPLFPAQPLFPSFSIVCG